jgi:2-aminoadipate transaminase
MIALSSEVAYLKRSVMRDLLSLATAPGILSLAGGLPATEHLPLLEYHRCLNTVLDRDGARAMQYSPQHPGLRGWIAAYMRRRGVYCEDDQIFITNGGQQGLTIVSRLLLDPGQPAVIESATFTGIQQVTAGRGAEVISVPTDLETGVDVDALEAAFRQHHPKLAILIPDFHNPLGVSISQEKRQRIAALAAEHQVPVIEDDPYSALRFEGDYLPPIKAHDRGEGWVFYIGSFSKMLAPTVRLGWLVAPKNLIPKITALRESIDLESSILTQSAVYQFLSEELLEAHLANLNIINRERRDALLGALETHFGTSATWTVPQGGLFVWLTFNEQIDTWAAFNRAVEEKVVYIPGAAFATDGVSFRNAMRLNFSNAKPDAIREAVARLAHVFESILEKEPIYGR